MPFLTVCGWLSCTIIESRVFRFQGVHLQGDHVGGISPGDGEASSHRISIVRGALIARVVYPCNPFQSFPRSLSHPVHFISPECGSGVPTGEVEGLTRSFSVSSRFHQLDLQPDTWSKGHTVTFHPFILLHRQIPFFFFL